MKKLIFIALIILPWGIFAQSGGVAISEDNSEPHLSAMLEVKSDSKGLLLPRVALTGVNDITTVANAANGLFVFSENGNVPDGLYYWNEGNTKWVYVITANDITDFGSGQVITEAERTLVNSALQSESDPVFTAHPSNNITNAGSGLVITDTERTSLNSALQSETDPSFNASVASEIAAEDTTRWNSIIGIPVGTIIPYAGTTIPDGWMACDGSPINRTNYATLFAAIGTAWGTGDGATTFNLPDLRGRFARGYDNGEGNDPDAATRVAINGGNTGDAVGSYQDDEHMSHNHALWASGYDNAHPSLEPVSGNNDAWHTGSSVVAQTDSRGGNETRPKNAYVNYIIKY
jgi:microcystin-dependent protein